MNKLQKYCLMPLLIILFLSTSGCGVLNPPHKDDLGFYTAHYMSCGPVAVQEALARYCHVNGIKFKKPITAKQISQDIQRNAPPAMFDGRKLLIIFDREAAAITWPSEIRTACQRYGVKLTKVSVDHFWSNPNDTYIILVHKKRTLNNYHWLAYPGHSAHYYGYEDTVFDIIYLLEPLQK